MVAAWEWRGGGTWHAYSPSQTAALEAAFDAGSQRVDLDAERHVDLRRMLQIRNDDSTRTRQVRRESQQPQPKRARVDAATAPPAAAPVAFRLNAIDPRWGLPPRANEGTSSLGSVLRDLSSATEVHLHNYMIDLDWVCSECPGLHSVPCVRVFHGDGRPPQSAAAQQSGGRVVCYQPPTEQYGTHHSKMIIVIRPERLSVCVTTANFIFSDWRCKTNGLYAQDFYPRAAAAGAASSGDLGSDLLHYYEAGLKRVGSSPPPSFRVGGRPPSDAERSAWAALPTGWLSRYDFSTATCRLVCSVPGSSAGVAAGRHAGDEMHHWGHMRMRALLSQEPLSAAHADAPIALQFSSLSSCGPSTKWLNELALSLCGGQHSIPRLRFIFPSATAVRSSLEGWVAGASIPCSPDNATKLLERCRELSGTSGLAKVCEWDGGDAHGAGVGACERRLAVPHIKTYARYDESDRSLAWALLTSSNLSQAAWGCLEKTGRGQTPQLYVKSGDAVVSGTLAFGNAADRHGRLPGDYYGRRATRAMHFYGPQATGLLLAENWAARHPWAAEHRTPPHHS